MFIIHSERRMGKSSQMNTSGMKPYGREGEQQTTMGGPLSKTRFRDKTFI